MLKTLLSGPNDNNAVLMLTGEADQDIAFQLMRAGALDYLSKAETTPSSLARAIRYARARREFLSELEAVRYEAEEKSRALDALNQQKTLLFSVVAHDLRNPFQSVLGLSDVLRKSARDKDAEFIERRADGIYQAASQAHALMESLFAWASLQMESVAVTTSAVELAGIAREVLGAVNEAAIAKRLSLRSDCHELHVEANRDMLSAVLRNLVSNAVKFSLPGGAVTISALRGGECVEVAVADTGIGISPDRLGNIFGLDRRVTTIGPAGERGSGLGLLLCRDLIERQGGKLKVESSLGHGTTFRFTLAEVAFDPKIDGDPRGAGVGTA